MGVEQLNGQFLAQQSAPVSPSLPVGAYIDFGSNQWWETPRIEPVHAFEYTPSDDVEMLETSENVLEMLLEDEPLGLTEEDLIAFLNSTDATTLDKMLQLDVDDCLVYKAEEVK
jgi:hypothetical protein